MSLSEMVYSFTNRFKNGSVSEREQVIKEIGMHLPSVAATLSMKIHQNLLEDVGFAFDALVKRNGTNYMAAAFMRMMENSTKPKLETYQGYYNNTHFEIGYDVEKNRFWYCLDGVFFSSPQHMSRNIAEEMLKLEVDRRLI